MVQKKEKTGRNEMHSFLHVLFDAGMESLYSPLVPPFGHKEAAWAQANENHMDKLQMKR